MFESAGVFARLNFFPKDISVAQKIQNEGAKEAVAAAQAVPKTQFLRILEPGFCQLSIKPSLPM